MAKCKKTKRLDRLYPIVTASKNNNAEEQGYSLISEFVLIFLILFIIIFCFYCTVLFAIKIAEGLRTAMLYIM